MALRLRVISDHRHRMGDKSTFVFGVSGGSIGRSAENDWVLPDDMRYVSGRHARVVFHKGRYLLQDTSSNGTFINDVEKPLGNQNPHELKSGDILRIGEYHVQVQIDSATDFSLDDSALYAT
ncbi:MAG TPA: type VI secretion system-associated FHA domain protein TagH, partial [Steroidobacteraceae bacterium]|nr:type VI secretion system-associated FHA domain protein TagH [Steroidobacteraceae bacterium]